MTQVLLQDIVRVFQPNLDKQPTVFKVEARKRTRNGVLKRGTVTHTFRSPDCEEWIDKIETLVQSLNAPVIN